MVVITFPDSETQKKALGFLLGRFSGKVLKNGEHIVPEAALEALGEGCEVHRDRQRTKHQTFTLVRLQWQRPAS